MAGCDGDRKEVASVATHNIPSYIDRIIGS